MCYELIAESDFPYETNVLPLMEKIDLEVAYCLRQMMWYQRDDLIPGQSVQISVSKLAELYTIRALCDETGVRDSLQRGGHRLSPDGVYVILDFIDESRDDWCDDAEDEDSNRLDVHTECLSNVGQMKQLIVTVDNTSGISQHDSGVVVEESWDIIMSLVVRLHV
uniref:Uncharacterized protein n=1 Tax=Arion vulgaris TaxID=1028688 RepID=A0A0B7AL37_9EUPU